MPPESRDKLPDREVRLPILGCLFCGASGLEAILYGSQQIITLPNHPVPAHPQLNCIKSGSSFTYDYYVQIDPLASAREREQPQPVEDSEKSATTEEQEERGES